MEALRWCRKCSDRSWSVLLKVSETVRHSQSDFIGGVFPNISDWPNLFDWHNRSLALKVCEAILCTDTVRLANGVHNGPTAECVPRQGVLNSSTTESEGVAKMSKTV